MKKINLLTIVCIILFSTSFYTVSNAEDTPSDWSKEILDEIFKSKILDEKLNSKFRQNVTRKEFAYLSVVLLEKISGEKLTKSKEVFKDSDDEFVLKARNHNLIKGYEDGSFRPDKNINRAEVCKLFINVLRESNNHIEKEDFKLFNDDLEIPIWAKADVYAARDLSIVEGRGDNLFDAGAFTTREEALVMFNRVYKKFVRPSAEFYKKSISEGDKAPNFTLSDINGKEYSLSDFKGKPVLIFFGTSWDPSSLQMYEIFDEILQDEKTNLEIININATKKDREESVKEMIETGNHKFLVLLDKDLKTAVKYGTRRVPFSYFVDKKGIIAKIEVSAYSMDELKAYLKLLK